MYKFLIVTRTYYKQEIASHPGQDVDPISVNMKRSGSKKDQHSPVWQYGPVHWFLHKQKFPSNVFMQAPPFSQEELVQGLTSEREQKNIVAKNFDYELNVCLNSE